MMQLEPLMGRYFRLKQELAIAYRTRPWHSGTIDRLANDLAATERAIGALQHAALPVGAGRVAGAPPG